MQQRRCDRVRAARLLAGEPAALACCCPTVGLRRLSLPTRGDCVLAVGWCLRVGLSHRDLEERLAERGVEVDHLTAYRWCSGSRACWPRRPARAGTPEEIIGWWTRPMSEWPAAGGTSTVRSTSSARSSTCSSPRGATPRPPAVSS